MTQEASPAIKTTCPYCGVGCGVLAKQETNGGVSIAGDPDHPANSGRLCSKGSALAETLGQGDRLLYPMIAGRRASWDEALDLVAQRFMAAIAEHGPDSVAFYVSGQLLTEDYYVANKLMKGFIGSANIDTNSRLCMASSVAGHRRAFGSDTVPGNYKDLELAELVVLVGSNLAWCHPVLFQRLLSAKEKHGTKIIVIDPRRTPTAEAADLHLDLAPGSDVALFNGLLAHVWAAGAIDDAYVQAHTTGLMEALASALSMDLAAIAKCTGIDEQKLSEFYELFARHQNVVTVFSQGVNQSTVGTDKVNAIINCHLMTGRIGRPGMGPFSITGQPNAMGGREAGGLANMLAAHMDLDRADHRETVQGFWNSPRIASKPGLKAVDLFRAVGNGQIKALWIMATNPVDSLPMADEVRAALETCPFVVVSDVSQKTDTLPYAHVALPSTVWGEKDGTVTNSERCISRQRAFLAPPGEARHDWSQMAEVARRMGFAAGFQYRGPADIFAEHAALSAADNDGTRDFDIGAHMAISAGDYDNLTPFQWPQRGGGRSNPARFFADGGFYTPNCRARFISTPFRKPASATSPDFPFVLNTGRIRDQWHTMTRTAKSARLTSHYAEPFIEIHPEDAVRAGVQAAQLAVVSSPSGSVVVRVLVTDRQRIGSVFVPMHWTGQFSSKGRIGALIAGNVDATSGQPELKYTPVAVTAYSPAWYGFSVSTKVPVTTGLDYWALAPAKAGFRLEAAGLATPDDWTTFARQVLSLDDDAELLAYHDKTKGRYRFAVFEGEQLAGAFFADSETVGVSRSWACDQLGHAFAKESDRLRLLAGRGGRDGIDRGATVCACFDVGANQIAQAVASGQCADVAQIGRHLSAGTNCGSCRSEIGRIVSEQLALKAATEQPVSAPSADDSRRVS
ncbi:MAG: molybdopterin-dependent oxidoreductase [Hyphomicrobiaceae bacterium]